MLYSTSAQADPTRRAADVASMAVMGEVCILNEGFVVAGREVKRGLPRVKRRKAYARAAKSALIRRLWIRENGNSWGWTTNRNIES